MGDDERETTSAQAWEGYRPALLRVAYAVVGTWADAEDVVQNAWLRWERADRAEIRDPEAWLVTVTTRLALDHLRRERTRREAYVGPWLPEPVVTVDDPADRAVTADDVSFAMLVVLESLSPLERAVFVLREVFAYPHADVARILGRSEASVRQLAHRARAHVDERAPRYDVDADLQREVTERFMDATLQGRVDELLSLLAPDVELVSDSGGQAKAPRHVIVGRDKVARFLLAIAVQQSWAYRYATINGQTGLLVSDDETVRYATLAHLRDGRVQAISLIANPAKLRQIVAAVD